MGSRWLTKDPMTDSDSVLILFLLIVVLLLLLAPPGTRYALALPSANPLTVSSAVRRPGSFAKNPPPCTSLNLSKFKHAAKNLVLVSGIASAMPPAPGIELP